MKKWFYFFGFIGLVLFFVSLDYRFYKTDLLIKQKKQQLGLLGKSNIQDDESQKNEISSLNNIQQKNQEQNGTMSAFLSEQDFKKLFKHEVQEIAQLQNEPEIVEQRMKSLASKLSSKQIAELKNILLDAGQNGDERGMAVEILALNATPEAYQALVQMAEQEYYKLGSKVDFELALRAQSIEGLSLYKDKNQVVTDLNKIAAKTQYSFINDRANRAKSFLMGKASSPESQDVKALKGILSK